MSQDNRRQQYLMLTAVEVSVLYEAIAKGLFDENLEDILEAAHHRKREIRKDRKR